MAARERRHAAAAASAGAAFVDPLASVPAGALFAYASRFGPSDDARPSPHAAGIAAGLARLEALLLNEPPPGAHHVPPPPQAPTQQHQQQSPARDVDGGLSTAAALIAARVRSAVCVPLAPEEADALAHDLDAAPSAALTAGVTPLQLPSLVEANPRVAAAFVAACGSSGPPPMLAAYLLHLLPCRGGGSGGGGSGNERSTTGGIMGSGLQSRGGGGGSGGGGGGGGGGDDDDSGERGGATGKGGVCDSTRGDLFTGGGGGGGVSPPQHAPRPLHSASLDAQAVGGVLSISGGGEGGEGVKKALLTLRNLEVVHELLLRSHRAATSPTSTFTMPRDFVGLHLAHAMAAADSATSVGGITRAVRLVCSFAHALHRDGFLRTGGGGSGGGSVAGVGEDSCAVQAGVTPSQDDGGDEGGRDLCVGLTAFALAHVRVVEAAELYRVLVTPTPVRGDDASTSPVRTEKQQG